MRRPHVAFGTVLAVFVLVGTHPAVAMEAIDLEKGPQLPMIATDELHAALQARLPIVVVDARGPEVYAQGHIPGALNVPEDQAEKISTGFPKQAVIVVYCGGPQCPHSLIVGRWLVAHGWSRVRHYTQGLPGWQEAGYPVQRESVAPQIAREK